MADSTSIVTASITAENTGTDWLQLRDGGAKEFDVSVSGTFAGTVFLQRKLKGAADNTARDIESYTTGASPVGHMAGEWDVRLFVKTGGYTSGTAVLRLSI